MKALTDFQNLYLYPAPVDFRKSIDGLSYLVEQSMKLDPFEPALFLFCNRAKDKVKAIYWDRTGFALWYKRLDRERFRWPDKQKTPLVLEVYELEALLAGFSLSGHQTIFAESLIE